MIDSWTREFSLAFDFCPGKRRFGNVQNPAIVDTPVPDVPSKDNQIWLRVGQGMPIPLAWCLFAHVDDVPDS